MPETTSPTAGRRRNPRSLLAVLAALALVLGWRAAAAEESGSRFMLESRDLVAIETALAAEKPAVPPPASVAPPLATTTTTTTAATHTAML